MYEDTRCGQNQEFLDVIPGGIYIFHRTING